jgi:hypothetical protein
VCALGTLPAEWISPGSVLSSALFFLDLSSNRLTGSIPPGAGGHFLAAQKYSTGKRADVILDPMQLQYGLCGDIPSNMNVSSADGEQLTASMPTGACPGMEQFLCFPCISEQSSAGILASWYTICIFLLGQSCHLNRALSAGAALQLVLSS